jgi:hypothetical protein
MYDPTIRTLVEVVSAILCFILLRFMIKPYKLTGERRYLGLPLGFGFLGVSYILGAIAFSDVIFSFRQLAFLQLFARTFAYCFLVVTYYFSRKRLENSQIKWDITLSLLIVGLVASIVTGIIIPQFAVDSYQAAQVYVRSFNIICLIYISIHTLRSHVEKPDTKTLWIPFGFILLCNSQYSLLIWAIDGSIFAFNGALVLRLAALTIFLLVSYKTFKKSNKRVV